MTEAISTLKHMQKQYVNTLFWTLMILNNINKQLLPESPERKSLFAAGHESEQFKKIKFNYRPVCEQHHLRVVSTVQKWLQKERPLTDDN